MPYYTTLKTENTEETLRRYFNSGWIVQKSPQPNEVVIYASTFAEVFTELLEIHGCNEETISRDDVIRIANLIHRL